MCIALDIVPGQRSGLDPASVIDELLGLLLLGWAMTALGPTSMNMALELATGQRSGLGLVTGLVITVNWGCQG